MNLLAETLEEMAGHDQSPATVAWVGDRDGTFSGSWADFANLADFEYDAGYDSNEIDLQLVIVFLDGSWLERSEYEGSESWEYKTTPLRGGESLISEKQLTSRWYSPRRAGR